MNRGDFQNLSRKRLQEARILFRNQQFEGAYYLAGYTIECALKACIARKIKRYDFPDKSLANKCYTHKLMELIVLAGLESELSTKLQTNRNFEINWGIVKDWSEEKRYSVIITESEARDMLNAINSKTNGIMHWLRSKW
jgi:HEPN domain-containing protein